MKKIRRMLALFVAVALAAGSIGCSKEVTAEDLMANVEATNASEVYIDEAVCDKYCVAAFKMLKSEYPQDNTNVVLSPLAVYYDLSLLSNGATGKTQTDLQSALGKLYPSDYLNSNMHSFNENYDTMTFQDWDNVFYIGKVIGVIDEFEDIARDEDIEKYFSVHERAGY